MLNQLSSACFLADIFKPYSKPSASLPVVSVHFSSLLVCLSRIIFLSDTLQLRLFLHSHQMNQRRDESFGEVLQAASTIGDMRNCPVSSRTLTVHCTCGVCMGEWGLCLRNRCVSPTPGHSYRVLKSRCKLKTTTPKITCVHLKRILENG